MLRRRVVGYENRRWTELAQDHVGLWALVQGGSNMTGTDLCVRLYKSVPVIFEPPCIWDEEL
jgi:hypothetical protein